MKPFLLAAIVLALAFSVFSPDSAAARTKKSNPTPTPEKVNAGGPKITKVSGDTVTIESSKTSTTFRMAADTSISVDGHPARGTELRPGMSVEYTESTIHPGLLRALSAKTPTKG